MNELEQQQPSAPQNHTWIFVLLLCAIMLMIGVFGFAIFSIYSDIDSTEVQEEVLPESPDTALEEESEQPAPEETPSTPTASYKSYSGLPSFEFPLSWHVLVQTGGISGGYYDNNILLNDQPIQLCEGCDGPVFPITITDYSEGFEDAPTEQMLKDGFKDHITGQLPANLKEQRTTLPNGRLYSVSGTTPDALYAPHFEELLLFTGNDGNIIYVHYTDIDNSGAYASVWQHLKSTLSFIQN